LAILIASGRRSRIVGSLRGKPVSGLTAAGVGVGLGATVGVAIAVRVAVAALVAAEAVLVGAGLAVGAAAVAVGAGAGLVAVAAETGVFIAGGAVGAWVGWLEHAASRPASNRRRKYLGIGPLPVRVLSAAKRGGNCTKDRSCLGKANRAGDARAVCFPQGVSGWY